MSDLTMVVKVNHIQLRIQDFQLGGGGAPTRSGDADLRHRHFSAKTKEFGPVGGGRRRPLDPPLILTSII